MIFLISFFMLILQACSTPQRGLIKNLDISKCLQKQKQIRRLHRYQMRGTLTYFSNQHLKIYAYFFCNHFDKSSYHLLLVSPLGGNKLEIIIRPNSLTLINNKNHRYIIYDNEEEIRKFTGISIPIDNLCQWVIGLPGKNTNYRFNDRCELIEINFVQKCETWKVVYKKYNRKIQLSLPSHIEIKEGNKCIKLKINSWVLE